MPCLAISRHRTIQFIERSDDTLPFAIGPLRLNRLFYDGALHFDLPGALTVM
jgi:hypothetical protein